MASTDGDNPRLTQPPFGCMGLHHETTGPTAAHLSVVAPATMWAAPCPTTKLNQLDQNVFEKAAPESAAFLRFGRPSSQNPRRST